MNERQRVLTILNGGVPDRVPWLGDLTYWAHALEVRGQVPPGFQRSEAYYDFHRELGVGFYLQGYEPFRRIYDETITVEERHEGNRHIQIVHTPLGALREVRTFLPDSFTEAPTEDFVKSPADLPILRYWFEHTRFEPDYAEAARRLPLVQDLGVVLCYLPKTPFMQLVVLLSGIETVVDLWMDARAELEATLEVIERKSDEADAIALASPAECLMIPENLSSEVVGKRFYELYVRGYETKWNQRIHEAGKFSFIHLDGTVRGLLCEVVCAGFRVVEAVTPAPVGDMPMHEMATLAGHGPGKAPAILWGGLPGVYFTDLVSAIVGIFGFMYHWNDFMGPLIYLTSAEKRTLSLGLNYFKDMFRVQTELLMAGSTIMIVPIIILFLIAQRYFVQGIALTGMKA